jgi:hypothetical protein
MVWENMGIFRALNCASEHWRVFLNGSLFRAIQCGYQGSAVPLFPTNVEKLNVHKALFFPEAKMIS